VYDQVQQQLLNGDEPMALMVDTSDSMLRTHTMKLPGGTTYELQVKQGRGVQDAACFSSQLQSQLVLSGRVAAVQCSYAICSCSWCLANAHISTGFDMLQLCLACWQPYQSIANKPLPQLKHHTCPCLRLPLSLSCRSLQETSAGPRQPA
jgi:hypothetical protein